MNSEGLGQGGQVPRKVLGQFARLQALRMGLKKEPRPQLLRVGQAGHRLGMRALGSGFKPRATSTTCSQTSGRLADLCTSISSSEMGKAYLSVSYRRKAHSEPGVGPEHAIVIV